MKKKDILTDIADRTIGKTPLHASSLNFTILNGGSEAFNQIFDSLRNEFPFIFSEDEELQGAELEKLDGLFSWLAGQLQEFPKDDEKSSFHLIKLIALAAFLERNHPIWEELAKAVPDRSELLIDALANLFSEHRFDAMVVLRDARFTADQTKMILADVAAKDWRALEWTLGRLWEQMWLPTKQYASAALYHFERKRLASILDMEDDFFEIVSYVLHAPSDNSLQLALSSTNWTLKFWALQNSARRAAAGEKSFDKEWESLLFDAAQVPDEWSRWMRVLNEYPARYPQLQTALGKTLSIAPYDALKTYISTISMASGLGRPEAATALLAFRDNASDTQRKQLWAAAFEAWNRWDFGRTEYSKTLLRVTVSSLDFAVIGYMTECMDASARAALAATLEARAHAIESEWHRDISPAISERFNILSLYRLLAHADAVANGKSEWLWDPPITQPSWEDGTLYRSLKYDPDLGKATFINS